MNNGFSTGYFQLYRGTRQGDPLAPYLFILVIEVLASLIRQNKDITGISVGNKELKLCMFADDSTFVAKDIKSLEALKSTINTFSEVSSLKINYEKSEASWIGAGKHLEHNFHHCKWINLTTDCMKILGIYVSYNTDLTYKMNSDRVLNSFKTVSNIWKGRNMTIIGRTEVVKTLALSKVLYVCEILTPSKQFLDKISSFILEFIWKGKPAKVSFQTVTQPSTLGGLGLPNIYNRIKTQRIMWIKRLIMGRESPWLIISEYYLTNIGGRANITSNFCIKSTPTRLPCFYKYCLKEWAGYVSHDPKTLSDVSLQPVWNNSRIAPNGKSIFVKDLYNLGIQNLYNIVGENGKLKTLKEIIDNDVIQRKYFLLWNQILASIPTEWRNKIKCKTEKNIFLDDNQVHISCKQCTIPVKLLNSNSMLR